MTSRSNILRDTRTRNGSLIWDGIFLRTMIRILLTSMVSVYSVSFVIFWDTPRGRSFCPQYIADSNQGVNSAHSLWRVQIGKLFNYEDHFDRFDFVQGIETQFGVS